MATIFAPFERVTPEEFKRATEVTYLGCVHGTMAALKRMRPRNRGAVVQVGSALACRAIPLQAPYCGAKFAIRGFTDSLRCELHHDGSAVHRPWSSCRRSTPRSSTGGGTDAGPAAAGAADLHARGRGRGDRVRSGARRASCGSGPSIQAILATRVVPGLLDRYLATEGYDGQMSDEPARDGAPDNLFTPCPAITAPMAVSARSPARAARPCGRASIGTGSWPGVGSGRARGGGTRRPRARLIGPTDIRARAAAGRVVGAERCGEPERR